MKTFIAKFPNAYRDEPKEADIELARIEAKVRAFVTDNFRTAA